MAVYCKSQNESLVFTFDFSTFPEATNGATLTAAVLTSAAPFNTTAVALTQSSVAFDITNTKAQYTIGGGTGSPATVYYLSCVGTFNNGSRRERDGRLVVDSPVN